MLLRALAISPETSIALRCARYQKQLGLHSEALIMLGFAYARSPRRNEVALEFAQSLIDARIPVRAAQVVDEILGRSPSDSMALRLKDCLENER